MTGIDALVLPVRTDVFYDEKNDRYEKNLKTQKRIIIPVSSKEVDGEKYRDGSIKQQST